MRPAVLALAVLALATLAWLALRGPRLREQALPHEVDGPVSPSPNWAAPGDGVAELAAEREKRAPLADSARLAADPPSGAEPRASSILLFGFVRVAASATEPSSPPSLSITDRTGSRQRAEVGVDGAYSVPALAPGPYWLSAFAGGGSVHRTLQLDGERAEVRCDLEIEPPERHVLGVRIVDGRGEPIDLRDAAAVATRDPLPDWFHTNARNDSGGPEVLGVVWRETSAPSGVFARLVTQTEPPFLVHLVHFQRVVATREVEAGRTEVVFAFVRDDPLLATAAVRVCFVDASDRSPIRPDSAQLHSQMRFYNLFESDGCWRAERVPPGKFDVLAFAPGYANGHAEIVVEPGADLDAEIALERASTISGRVVDPDGQGASVEYHIEPLGHAGPFPILNRSGPDGSFEARGLTRGTYLLRVTEAPWGTTATVVDATAGSVEGVRIQLARGVPLLVRGSDELWRETAYRVLDRDGLEIDSGRLESPAPARTLLAPGSYEIVVSVSGAETRRIPVAIESGPVEIALP